MSAPLGIVLEYYQIEEFMPSFSRSRPQTSVGIFRIFVILCEFHSSKLRCLGSRELLAWCRRSGLFDGPFHNEVGNNLEANYKHVSCRGCYILWGAVLFKGGITENRTAGYSFSSTIEIVTKTHTMGHGYKTLVSTAKRRHYISRQPMAGLIGQHINPR